MYSNSNNYEKSLHDFGSRVDIIVAMEMADKIDTETAYQNIKMELKALKKNRKLYMKGEN